MPCPGWLSMPCLGEASSAMLGPRAPCLLSSAACVKAMSLPCPGMSLPLWFQAWLWALVRCHPGRGSVPGGPCAAGAGAAPEAAVQGPCGGAGGEAAPAGPRDRGGPPSHGDPGRGPLQSGQAHGSAGGAAAALYDCSAPHGHSVPVREPRGGGAPQHRGQREAHAALDGGRVGAVAQCPRAPGRLLPAEGGAAHDGAAPRVPAAHGIAAAHGAGARGGTGTGAGEPIPLSAHGLPLAKGSQALQEGGAMPVGFVVADTSAAKCGRASRSMQHRTAHVLLVLPSPMLLNLPSPMLLDLPFPMLLDL